MTPANVLWKRPSGMTLSLWPNINSRGGLEVNPRAGSEVDYEEDQSRSARGQSRSQSNISMLYFLTQDAALILKRPSSNTPLRWNTPCRGESEGSPVSDLFIPLQSQGFIQHFSTLANKAKEAEARTRHLKQKYVSQYKKDIL